LKVALIGLPGSGKTTLFSSITGLWPDEKDALKPHLGTVFMPDERLDNLAKIFHSSKITYADTIFLDTHSFDLIHSKEAQALIVVIGAFSGASPKKDMSQVCADTILSDLQILEHRLPTMKKEIEAGKKIKDQPEYNMLLKCKGQLEKAQPLKALTFSKEEEKLVHGYQFLSLKPLFFILNTAEEDIGRALDSDFAEFVKKENLEGIKLCAKIELEILELSESERPDFLKSIGIAELSKGRIIKMAHKILDLVSFFTVKGDEARSWPIKNGTHAIDAAGKVHTDIQRGFIKAEVINYRDFMECGDFNEAKKRGLLRLEGKDYIVQDGDIINFKFNI
jgi:ribosome-binding ATPase YchF (GTP1/OBG family)